MSADFSFKIEEAEDGYILKCEYAMGASYYDPTYCCPNFSDLQARIDEILEKLSKAKKK